jgi:hypothetical protein
MQSLSFQPTSFPNQDPLWSSHSKLFVSTVTDGVKNKGKVNPVQAWTGGEGSRSLKLPDFKTTAHEGGKVVSPTHQPTLPLRKYPWYSFYSRLSRSQCHSAAGRIMTPSEIETATFLLAGQCSTNCATTCPLTDGVVTHTKDTEPGEDRL